MSDMTQDKAMMRLYEHLTTAKRPETKFVGLGEDERRAYMREAMRKSRARKREAAAAGKLEADKATIRDALADAAIMLVATGGPGSKEILAAIGRAFGADRPGVPFSVAADCRTGKIRPKLLIKA